MLTPRFRAWPIDPSTLVLVSEGFSAALHGRLYRDLVPLLDGALTREEIALRLSPGYSRLQVQSALVSMASRRYIVSSEFAMTRAMAAFWSVLGASPRWAEKRLRETPVRVTGSEPALEAALSGLGISLVNDQEALTVVTTDDFADERHGETNRRQREAGIPWVLIRTAGVTPLYGPVFRPRGQGPCWACLAHRLRANQEVELFLRNTQSSGQVPIPTSETPVFASAVRGLAATEIAKWIVLGDASAIHDHALSVDPHASLIERHLVMRRPQCLACGDEAHYRPDRAPRPVELRSSPNRIANSGGLRSVPPEETVRRYRHLVSPISGVVTRLVHASDPGDTWMHVFWSGSNLALRADSLHLLRSSLRAKTAGKGSTGAQAEASALCEAIERYSGLFQGDEIRIERRFVDFADGEAIHPNELQLYSERQYDRAREINARESRFNVVPSRFDPTAELNWTPVWSLTRRQHRYVLTAQMFYSMAADPGNRFAAPDSNGSAAGNTLEEAILQGFFELVERDAFACWWYNRVRLPEMDLASFGDPWLSQARKYYESFHRSLWLLDATHDLGVPVFIAVSGRTDKTPQDIIFAAGAHSDPRIAAGRAVSELNQYLYAVRDVGPDGDYAYDDAECLWWWRNATMEEMSYLVPDPGARVRRMDAYSSPKTTDLLDEVTACQERVERLGMEFLVFDYTRPDIGMPVAKTLVPGMRHYWARHGPGRLYEVPVRMGWLDEPTPETALNPIPVFI